MRVLAYLCNPVSCCTYPVLKRHIFYKAVCFIKVCKRVVDETYSKSPHYCGLYRIFSFFSARIYNAKSAFVKSPDVKNQATKN
jgi:hypothetical protein